MNMARAAECRVAVSCWCLNVVNITACRWHVCIIMYTYLQYVQYAYVYFVLLNVTPWVQTCTFAGISDRLC